MKKLAIAIIVAALAVTPLGGAVDSANAASPKMETKGKIVENVDLSGNVKNSAKTKGEEVTTLINGGKVETGKLYLAVAAGPETTNDYFKYTAKNTGTLAIVGPSGKVRLCNSKKKPLSKENTIASADENILIKSVIYGVKKGTTYWINIKDNNHDLLDSETGNHHNAYALEIINDKLSEKSGSSKGSSVSMKNNKDVAGLQIAGEKKADYYKFKSTKTNNLLRLAVLTNSKIKVDVYHKYGSKTYKRTISGDRKNPVYELKMFGTGGKGTYYIKVYGTDKDASGMYEIKWK